jgi:hypothetical protein
MNTKVQSMLSDGSKVDPALKLAMDKLEKENAEKTKMIDGLKDQMAKQAQQFMAMMEQPKSVPQSPAMARPPGKK